MTITFKYVTKPVTNAGPLGIVNQIEHPGLMVGTDCANPDDVEEGLFNWHFRLEGVPDLDIFPKQLDGPAPAYGIWFNPSLTSTRESNKCNELNNWPMNAVQSQAEDETYTNSVYRNRVK